MEALDGKVVLVTGGSAGIGKAAAMAFARAGARVVLTARGVWRGEETAHEIAASGGFAIYMHADMSREEDVRRVVHQTVEMFGRLDAAFNNAACLTRMAPAGGYSAEDFDKEVTLNLKSVWLCMKYELEQMLRQKPQGGAIVNTSSVNGLGGARFASLYSMSKAGVLALTKAAAQEYAADNIRINALVAGGFDTDMLHTAMAQSAGGDEDGAQRALDAMVAYIPAGRIGRPDEAAQAALWLCSDAASYVTGQSMIVDGGLTAWAR